MWINSTHVDTAKKFRYVTHTFLTEPLPPLWIWNKSYKTYMTELIFNSSVIIISNCQKLGHSFCIKNTALTRRALQGPKSWSAIIFLWWLRWLVRTDGKPTCINIRKRSWKMSTWQKKLILIAWMWVLLVQFEYLYVHKESNSKNKIIMTEQSFLIPFPHE